MIGNTDVAATVILANEVDRLGMDNNETGWLMAWGNVEAIRAILRKIAHREGIGDQLAEGVKQASERLWRGSEELAVYTLKGNSPRGHAHGARWSEMAETNLSDTGTLMAGPVKAGRAGGAT